MKTRTHDDVEGKVGPGFKNGKHWTQTASGRKKLRAMAALRSRSGTAPLTATREKDPEVTQLYNAIWDRMSPAEKKLTLASIVERGFTLIELLVVVAIILIIAAIAIPRLISARAAAQEGAGAGTLRTVNTALAAYQSRYGAFPAGFALLGGTCSTTVPPTAALSCQLDNTIATNLAGGTIPVSSYIYTYVQTNGGSGFTLNADPAPGANATRHYFSAEGLTIHWSDTAAAAATDPTL